MTRPARSRRWGSFPTTADVGIWATGGTVAELFEALGLGLFALITDLHKVRPRDTRLISTSGTDPAALVVAYLTQLLLLQQIEGFVACQIKARPIGTPPTAVFATVSGENFDPLRHTPRVEVKAITWHALTFDLATRRARVIVDI
ncbi:MAG: archease [Thermoplasmata archaeon]